MDYGETVQEFEEFFTEEYHQEVSKAVENQRNVVVEFQKLDMFSPEVTDHLRENPEKAIEAAEEGLQAHEKINSGEMTVKFRNFPEHDFVLIDNLDVSHIGKLIPIKGEIVKAKKNSPEIVSGVFECVQCGDLYEKEQAPGEDLKAPYKCDCGSKKFEVQEKIMQDTQKIWLKNDEWKLPVKITGDQVIKKIKNLPGTQASAIGVLREVEEGDDAPFKLEVNNFRTETS
ncbi:MAG: hypothetical protein ABEJ83_01025 [Candidatus Nanohaloarchaea archaeon]